MITAKKIVLLFLALLLPVMVFMFLRIFGKNEFDVPALYQDAPPEQAEGCPSVSLPYHVPDTVLSRPSFAESQLAVIVFDVLSVEVKSQLQRVSDKFTPAEVSILFAGEDDQRVYWKKCIFFLKEPFNIVMVDKKGKIRGQYSSSNRDEIDRLITEAAILLKKY